MAEAPAAAGTRLQLTTLDDCGLVIGRYPRFRYNASGGGGTSAPRLEGDNVLFPGQLTIPPLDWRSTRFLGLPLPLASRSASNPSSWRARSTATAVRWPCVSARASASGSSWGQPSCTRPRICWWTPNSAATAARASAITPAAEPSMAAARALLVGVAMVPPSGDAWLDRFLGLPDEALAVLRCRITGVGEQPA